MWRMSHSVRKWEERLFVCMRTLAGVHVPGGPQHSACINHAVWWWRLRLSWPLWLPTRAHTHTAKHPPVNSEYRLIWGKWAVQHWTCTLVHVYYVMFMTKCLIYKIHSNTFVLKRCGLTLHTVCICRNFSLRHKVVHKVVHTGICAIS